MLEKCLFGLAMDSVRSNSALKESDLGQVFTDLVESVLINASALPDARSR